MSEEISWVQPNQEKSAAHADTLRNFKYAGEAITRHKEAMKHIDHTFSGVSKDIRGNFAEPTCISFFWKERDVRLGVSTPLSQPRESFNRWIDGFINSVAKAHWKPPIDPRTIQAETLF